MNFFFIPAADIFLFLLPPLAAFFQVFLVVDSTYLVRQRDSTAHHQRVSVLARPSLPCRLPPS
jgi:hypothetical protein